MRDYIKTFAIIAVFCVGFFGLCVGLGHCGKALADSKEMPTPTFEDVHLAYFRIVANEAPFRSVPDHDGILQSLLYGGGGRRWAREKAPGVGYGLKYKSLMKRMIAHSPRTFPADSPFLMFSREEQERHRARQSNRNLWSSSLTLNCERDPVWDKRYQKSCKFAVRSTGRFLKGRERTKCSGRPTTWGNEADTHRPGGPADSGWLEIFCNRDPYVDCHLMTVGERLREPSCAKNHFWTWLQRQ